MRGWFRGRERARAQPDTDVVGTIGRVGRLIDAETDRTTLAQAVIDAATQLSGAAFGAFFSTGLDPSGARTIECVLSASARDASEKFPVSADAALLAQTLRGEPPLRLDDVRTDPRYAEIAQSFFAPQNHLPLVSYLAVPVVARSGDVEGALVLGHPERGMFTERHEQIVTALAAHAASALENVRRFEDTAQARVAAEAAVREAHAAREKAERERWQAAFLSEASRLLASSLDYDATLDALIRLLVPTLADWAVVHLARRDGGLRRIGPAYADPTLAPLAAVSRRVTPPIERGVSTSAAAVVREGQPLLVTDISREWLERTVDDPEYLAFVMRLDPHSLLIVPLVARGRALGALTLVALKRGRRYGEADLIFAEEIGRRMGLAVDNARLYRQVERAKADAEEANRAKDEFLAVLSHELRTPLNAVNGWIQLVGEGTLQGVSAGRALETVRHNVSVLRRLSEDLLDASAIIAGKLTIDVMPCDLATVIADTVESFRRDAEAGGVTLSAALERGVIASADVVRLRQMIGNLLANAVKFTPAGGTISVTLTRVDASARIVVADTGPGIPQAVLSRVFDRFWQAERNVSAPGGLGLGLAIVKHLAELHGGAVRAENRADGHGAAFSIELPTVA